VTRATRGRVLSTGGHYPSILLVRPMSAVEVFWVLVFRTAADAQACCRGGSQASWAAADIDEDDPSERKELAQSAPSAACGGQGGAKLGERPDQAAPPRAPPIRCKRKRNKGYGCCNNEIAHPVLLGSRLPTSGRMPRPPLATLVAVHRHTFGRG
jgi:hypothetical protein